MSTQVTASDQQSINEAFAHLRAEEADVQSYVLARHQNGNPNIIELEKQGVSITDLAGCLDETQVQYAMIRMQETFDMSTTVKFVYIHWIGEKVPFVKKGRYGVVHGSVQDQFFTPSHFHIETSTLDDITEDNIMKLITETSGTKSKVLENNAAMSLPKRGFTSTPLTQPPKSKGPVIPVSSQGAEVKYEDDVTQAVTAVRSDGNEITWACVGYTSNDVKKPLQVIASGTGGIEEMKEQLQDDRALYFLYRTTDVVDGHTTVKFVYICWVGESVKPMAKAKLSTHKGVVQELFSGCHVTLFATARNELSESIVKDKVQSASGTKSHVK